MNSLDFLFYASQSALLCSDSSSSSTSFLPSCPFLSYCLSPLLLLSPLLPLALSFSSLLVPCSTPSLLLLYRFVSHSDQHSPRVAGDPQCVCVLPGGRTPRCHHFHPGEFHGGCAAPSPAEHRAEDPGGGCCRGHAGPGPGYSHSCAGEFGQHG